MTLFLRQLVRLVSRQADPQSVMDWVDLHRHYALPPSPKTMNDFLNEQVALLDARYRRMEASLRVSESRKLAAYVLFQTLEAAVGNFLYGAGSEYA